MRQAVPGDRAVTQASTPNLPGAGPGRRDTLKNRAGYNVPFPTIFDPQNRSQHRGRRDAGRRLGGSRQLRGSRGAGAAREGFPEGSLASLRGGKGGRDPHPRAEGERFRQLSSVHPLGRRALRAYCVQGRESGSVELRGGAGTRVLNQHCA